MPRRARTLILALLAAMIASTAQAADPIRVITFNIRYGSAPDGANAWPHRRDQVLDLLRDTDADIIGLQESLTAQLDEILAALPGYALIGVGRDDGKLAGEWSPILVRTSRFTIDRAETRWLSDTPLIPNSAHWGNRICRIVTRARLIDRASGQPLHVLNTHWDHESQPAREKSARAILDLIRDEAPAEPVILLGDFNADEANPAITTLLGVRTPKGRPRLTSAFRAVHPDETNVRTYHAFEGGAGPDMIDHIFVSGRFTTDTAAIDRRSANGRYPSDHFPVVATLRLD